MGQSYDGNSLGSTSDVMKQHLSHTDHDNNHRSPHDHTKHDTTLPNTPQNTNAHIQLNA